MAKSSASDPDKKYIYFIGSETLPSTCCILSEEYSIAFYSKSVGYTLMDNIIGVFFFSFLTFYF